jgi:hypothetical protein
VEEALNFDRRAARVAKLRRQPSPEERAVVDLRIDDRALVIDRDDDRHFARANTAVGGNGEMGGPAAVEGPGEHGRTAVGLLLLGGRLGDGFRHRIL